MTYLQLVKDSKYFHRKDDRGKLYDYYMAEKDWSIWTNSAIIPRREVILLFWFILSWDKNFRGDLDKFIAQYTKIFSTIAKLKTLLIWDMVFSNEIKEDISYVFDTVAKCTLSNRYESTDSSKILHTILPNLFVMWDDKIRTTILGRNSDRNSRLYAYKFLPKMKDEIDTILHSYIDTHRGSIQEANAKISRMCNGYTLCKLIDESNYVRRYTRI